MMEDSAISLGQKAASVRVAQMNCEGVAEEEGSWKALGCYLVAVSVAALLLGEHCSQLPIQLLPPSGDLAA